MSFVSRDSDGTLRESRDSERLRSIARTESKLKAKGGPPLKLLSLDGGGIKGYSTLLLLEEVMYRLYIELEGKPPGMNDIYKPCDVFDLIGGTGTGGLIAIMLGRLRMPIETVKTVWVQMSKRVFETDKTIAGIPIRKTLFKASLLESATKEIVREYTKFEDDDVLRQKTASPPLGNMYDQSEGEPVQRTPTDIDEYAEDTKIKYQASQIEQLKSSTCPLGLRIGSRLGNPDALLYDDRKNRCKTFVAAMYQNSTEDIPPCLLRSYHSSFTLNTEPSCKIWEAARATSANLAAFKPIQINQTVFLDEGAGKYNITPTLLEEAVENEWPGQSVGCLISIGTGKPPPLKISSGHPWWENLLSTPFDNFAEAKKRLILKTAGSEDIHQRLLSRDYGLSKWNVAVEDYFRLNVEIGVGEYGMNDWTRLSDISTNTRRYLGSEEGKRLVGGCALKLAVAHRAKHMPPAPKANPTFHAMVELQGDLKQMHRRKRSTDDKPPTSNRHIASQLQRSQSQQTSIIPDDSGSYPPTINMRPRSRRMTAPPLSPPPNKPLPERPNPPYPLD